MHLAYNYPCSLLSLGKLTKLPPQTGEPLNPQDGRLVAFPPVGSKDLCIQSTLLTPLTCVPLLCIQC